MAKAGSSPATRCSAQRRHGRREPARWRGRRFAAALGHRRLVGDGGPRHLRRVKDVEVRGRPCARRSTEVVEGKERKMAAKIVGETRCTSILKKSVCRRFNFFSWPAKFDCEGWHRRCRSRRIRKASHRVSMRGREYTCAGNISYSNSVTTCHFEKNLVGLLGVA